jgi:hypothetical protein
VKVDLDELERKARAATQEGAWEIRVPDHGAGIEGVIVQTDGDRQIAECYDSTPWSDTECIANGEHIAAASPPVVLALIARIREMEGAMSDAANHLQVETYCENRSEAGRRREVYDRLTSLLEKGAVLP